VGPFARGKPGRSFSAKATLLYEMTISGVGPTLPTWALQQVGSYLRHTGRDANIVAVAALDP
jgi:hypothetical protein